MTTQLALLAPGGVILFQPGLYFPNRDPVWLAGYFLPQIAAGGLIIAGVINWYGSISDWCIDEEMSRFWCCVDAMMGVQNSP